NRDWFRICVDLMGLGSFRLRAVLAATVLVVCATCARGQQAALDLDGRTVNPLDGNSNKVAVLVFLRRDCPVSSRYAPVIQQISKEYGDRANFWLVYPDKSDSPQAIRKYLQDYGYHLPALRDPKHALVKVGHAQITPEVA